MMGSKPANDTLGYAVVQTETLPLFWTKNKFFYFELGLYHNREDPNTRLFGHPANGPRSGTWLVQYSDHMDRYRALVYV